MLKLKADPTFKVKVPIPVPGGDTVDVEMEFKHRTRKELADFLIACHGTPEVPGVSPEVPGMDDEESVMQTVVGWEFKDPFNKKSVAMLVQNYHGAARAIAKTYLFELSQVRAKN